VPLNRLGIWGIARGSKLEMKVGDVALGDDRIGRVESNASSHILSWIAVDVAPIEDEIGRNLLQVRLVDVPQRDNSIVRCVAGASGVRWDVWVHRQFEADEPVGPGRRPSCWIGSLKRWTMVGADQLREKGCLLLRIHAPPRSWQLRITGIRTDNDVIGLRTVVLQKSRCYGKLGFSSRISEEFFHGQPEPVQMASF